MFDDSAQYRLPSLYTRGSKPGEIRIYDVIVTDVMGNVTITMKWGILGGKTTKKEITGVKGKNIGRSNATTPFQQGKKDAEAIWTKKIKKGYSTLEMMFVEKVDDFHYVHDGHEYENLTKVLQVSLPESKTDGITGAAKPMLAKKHYKKDGSWLKITYPRIAQRKRNGERCIADHTNMRTRSGELYGSWFEFIHSEVKSFPKTFTYQGETYPVVFDGEMYCHDMPLNSIRSAIAKLNMNTHSLQYWVFDLVAEGIPQHKRLRILRELFNNNPTRFYVNRYKHVIVNSREEVEDYLSRFLNEGYEGLILRSIQGMYQHGKRPNDLIKVKTQLVDYFQIIDIDDSARHPEIAIFTCRNDKNSHVFSVNSNGTSEERKAIYHNSQEYIGKWLEVKYYERSGAKQVPFHSVAGEIVDKNPNAN